MKRSWWYLLPVFALCFVAAAKKEPDVTVRFYTEGMAGDANSFPDPIYLQDPSRKIYRSKTASISEHDIAAIYPFRTTDGSIGCVFMLNDAGKAALETLSVEKRNSSLTAVVNDRMIINLFIDQRISDGILVIPHGMTVKEGMLLQKSFHVVKTPPYASPAPGKAAAPAPQ